MVKKSVDVALIQPNPQTSADLSLTLNEQNFASYLEVDLAAPMDVLLDRARQDAQDGLRASLKLGLRLLGVRSKCEHGAFSGLLQEADIGERNAQICMQLARAYACEDDPRRMEALLGMGKSKAVALLGVAPEVREKIMESPELLKEMLEGNAREFQAQIKQLQKTVDHLQANQEIKASKKVQEAESHFVSPNIPYLVTDVRREAAALYKQAQLSIASLHDLAPQLDALHGVKGCTAWVSPSKVQAFNALRSLHAQLSVCMINWTDEHGITSDQLPSPEDRAFYHPDEAVMVQQHFEALTTAHLVTATKRAKLAANAVPGKRGRDYKVD